MRVVFLARAAARFEARTSKADLIGWAIGESVLDNFAVSSSVSGCCGLSNVGV